MGTAFPSNDGNLVSCIIFRMQYSDSGGAPLTRSMLARPLGSASKDKDTMGLPIPGLKHEAIFPMTGPMERFMVSRVKPRGFPFRVDEGCRPPPAGMATVVLGAGVSSPRTTGAMGVPPWVRSPGTFSRTGASATLATGWMTGTGGGPLSLLQAGNTTASITPGNHRYFDEIPLISGPFHRPV
jgi:hypothetical protein